MTDACDHCIAIFDSAFPYIAGPAAVMDPVIALVPKVDPGCANLASLPNISFQFSGTQFTLAPDDYVVRLPSTPRNTTFVCTLALESFDASGGLLPT